MPVVDATVVIDGRGSGVAGGATVAAAGRPVEPVLAPELLRWNAPASWPPAFAAGRWSGADADRAAPHLVADRRHLDRAWEFSRRYDNHPV